MSILKQVIRVLGVVVILISLMGCMQVNTVIKLKSDSSGTIEETVLISKEAVKQMKAMMEQMANQMGKMGGKADIKKSFDIFDEAQLKMKASKMGEGVKYVSGKKVITDKFEGYKAVYAFIDINKIKINQNPGENMPSSPGPGGGGATGKKKEFVKFQFIKGSPATLIIKRPLGKKNSKMKSSDKHFKPPQVNEQQEKMMMAQMKKMLEGMKVAITIDIDGTIIQTNATHRKGSRITLMEMDFGKLLGMPEKFKKFTKANPQTLEDAKKLMKDIPGIKVDLNKEIKIKFK